MKLRQRVREYAYEMGFGLDEDAEQRVLDGEAGVPGGSLMEGRLLAVQVAKNSWTPDDDIEAVKADYVYCVDKVARYSDIIVVNVSSPNTPGLRGLQRVGPLTEILKGVVEAAKRTNKSVKPAVMVKVSPDEDEEAQVRGICDAVWESGVDGVIVGNTTKRRPEMVGRLPSREAALLMEQGGYSGPQMFERTRELTRRYRILLDEGLDRKVESESKSTPPTKPQGPKRDSSQVPPDENLPSKIEASITRDAQNLKPNTAEAEAESKSQPLIRLPERHKPLSSDNSGTSDANAPALSLSHHAEQMPPAVPSQQPGPTSEIPKPAPSAQPNPTTETLSPKPKVIFATGGIVNGRQGKSPPPPFPLSPSPSRPPSQRKHVQAYIYTTTALEILEAGASVAQVYTALVYGGVGTIARIKDEMRDEMRRRQRQGVEGR